MDNLESVKPTLLVIDDVAENLTLMHKLLRDDYKVKGANNGVSGLQVAVSDHPDLILLDIMMPKIDGFEVCRQLKSHAKTKDIPVIFLTAKSEIVDEEKGLQLGAVDYISKPISPVIIKARIKNHLLIKSATELLKNKNITLECEIKRRTDEQLKQTKDLYAIQDIAINAMVSLAETRDNETGNHIRRTQIYIKLLAETLALNPRYKNQLNPNIIDLLYKSAPLHDIGKIGIPDNILMKPGKLTHDEFETMKNHTILGLNAIKNAESQSGTKMHFLKYAKEIAYSHHERWDGSGYPQGLAGEDIPLSARLMAVADVYDALVNKRAYKSALSHIEALDIIINGKGTHFDPDIIDVFLMIEKDIYSISQLYLN